MSFAKHVAYTYVLEMGGFALFGMTYFACDLVTSLHAYRVPLYLEAERAMPFVPAMGLAYCSLYLMFLIVPFILRTRREVHAFYYTYLAQVGAAAICYLALPVAPIYPPTPDAGSAFALADELNLTYNMFPSIHVAFAASAAMILSNRGARGVALYAWAALVSASTLLTHQHHVADVVGGIVLAIVAVRLIYFRSIGDLHRGSR